MRGFKQMVPRLAAIFVALYASITHADVFNMPGGQTSLQFVTVGDPNNAPDNLGHGAVGYSYQIGKYDVTVAQYSQFLNAVAKTDTYGLYDSWLGSGMPTVAIQRSGTSGSYSYSVTGGYNGTNSAGGNFPLFVVDWGGAARFVNWLENGQPVGAQGPGTTETGTYTLNGATTSSALLAITRNAGTTYVIPSENEWYKAAYYKGGGTSAGYWDYPTQSNTVPSNVLSASSTNNANYNDGSYTDPTNYLTPVGFFAASPGPYGTFDQGGDVDQWTETELSSTRVARGGRFGNPDGSSSNYMSRYTYGMGDPSLGYYASGLRVASVPEPGSISLLAAGAISLLGYAWHRRKRTA